MSKFVEKGKVTVAVDACESGLTLPRPLFYVTALEAQP